MSESLGYDAARVVEREAEITAISRQVGFVGVHRLGFPPARLDTVPAFELIAAVAKVIAEVKPDTLFVPWRYDIHSDHRIVFDSVAACTKSFRYPFIRWVLAYETPSETECAIDPGAPAFRPNFWVDVSSHMADKLALMASYPRDMGSFPFPRSAEAVESLARVRGMAAGVEAAEAFVVLKGIM
jgi:LmbE family N-acetylglucosaminyl deacetylase